MSGKPSSKPLSKPVASDTPRPDPEAKSPVSGVVRFMHAADLHLDAVFSGLSRDVPPVVAERLHRATFTALDNLFTLAETVRPDFLLLAGDIYNQEDRSTRAQLAVNAGCARLAEQGIPVFMVHGNHDPLSSRLRTLAWPDTVTVFDERISSRPVMRDNAPLAVIHGVSHAGPRETRNLAAGFVRGPEHCLHVGLLHTTLGDADGGARYAPCSVEDLRISGMDYWALGHVHTRKVVCEAPLAQYPGSCQGLHVNEPGPRGCLVVTASPNGDGFDFSTIFHPLGPVEWREIRLEAGEQTELSDLEPLLRESLDQAARTAVAAREPGGPLSAPCEGLIVRLRLAGRTALDATLRKPGATADLLERLRADAPSEPFVWVKDLVLETRPLIDRVLLAEREDLLGEIMRLSQQMRTDPETLHGLIAAALSDLYHNNRVRKALPLPEAADLLALLDHAEAVCLELLENE